MRAPCSLPGAGSGPRSDAIDAHWPGNVLDLLLAQILEDEGQPVAHMFVHGIGDEHPAGIGQGLDPRGDIDAVAIEVVALDDHVAEIDADAQLDAVVRRDTRVLLRHCLLHRDRAAHRVDDAGKFHQHAVAGGVDDAALMLGDFRIEEFAAQRLEALEGTLLVRSHQPRVARHIGGEDRRQPALDPLAAHLRLTPPASQPGAGRRHRARGTRARM